MGQTVNYSRSPNDKELVDERLEELRMLSGLKINEIHRLRALEETLPKNADLMNKDVDIKLTKTQFFSIPCIHLNPLSDRVAKCFGYQDDIEELDFQAFLCGVAAFNSPGHKEQKLHLLFRIQDLDDDGVLSRSDLSRYITLVTGDNLEEEEINEIISEVFNEIGSIKEKKKINNPQNETEAEEQPEEEGIGSEKDKNDVITYADYRRVVATLDFQAKLFLPI